MGERKCIACRYGEQIKGKVEEKVTIIAVKCMWGPPGIGYDRKHERFTKVSLNMHPDEWCYRWKPEITSLGMNVEGQHETIPD